MEHPFAREARLRQEAALAKAQDEAAVHNRQLRDAVEAQSAQALAIMPLIGMEPTYNNPLITAVAAGELPPGVVRGMRRV